MDPEAALARAEQHIDWIDMPGMGGDKRRVREYLAAYNGWRRGGGFEPENGDARARAISLWLKSGGKKRIGDANMAGGLRFNKWTLKIWMDTGYRVGDFRSDYRNTAQTNAGKRLSSIVKSRRTGMDANSMREAIGSIKAATLTNGVFTYELVSATIDGKRWNWKEVGPGL
jgi:hypothetical protein